MAIVSILFSLELYSISEVRESNNALLVLIALFAQSITQEVLFRGIIFRGLSKLCTVLTSSLILSTIFALLNTLVDGPFILPSIAAAFSTFILCMLYHWKKSLVLNAMVNTSWLYIVFLTGVLDEHWRASAPVISKFHGELYLSGGSFGPESSIFGVIVLAGAVFWFYQKYKKLERNTKPIN